MTDQERDPKVSQHYRSLAKDEPPAELDAAILAAARRAAESRPAPLVAPTGRRRWYFPLAAAAVIALAVGVSLQVERQLPDAETAVATLPQPPATPAPSVTEASPKPAVRPKKTSPPPLVPDSRPDQESRQADAASAAKAEAPALAEAPAAPAARPAPAPQMRAFAGRAAIESPEKWLERIAELRRQGLHDEADKSLAEFRRRYPEYRIPEAMLEKVEKK